jgi:hypothetical protein
LHSSRERSSTDKGQWSEKNIFTPFTFKFLTKWLSDKGYLFLSLRWLYSPYKEMSHCYVTKGLFTITTEVYPWPYSKQFNAVFSQPTTMLDINHHHHRAAIKELGHVLTRSGLTHPEVSSMTLKNSHIHIGLKRYLEFPWGLPKKPLNSTN